MRGGPYVIAEVGQNHNGGVQLAEELVGMAADSRPQEQAEATDLERRGCSAVKFTKRKLSQEMTHDVADAEYGGRNSFGHTYGEHRRHLEFTWPVYTVLSERAKAEGMDFGVTVCHPDLVKGALEHCLDLRFLKVASRDIGNVPLLEAMAKMAPPEVAKVISLGMATEKDLERVLRIFGDQLDSLTVMHCRSIYPTPPDVWDLQVIPWLRAKLNPLGVQVGYSDHALGNAAALAAVAMGAQVLEKHITLDRRMKGGDHRGAVDRGGLYRLLRDLEHIHRGTAGPIEIRTPRDTQPQLNKLGRSLCWASTLMAGTVVEEKHLVLASPGTGLSWDDRADLVGRKLHGQVEGMTLCALDDVT